ncbi:MAG TPA: translation initiation factor [Campylobacterales bacterium]|nr:translation initiation factor [Campylobacterales bacterium]HHS93338.1 translation initiation factor [Campylobacterales bacterium]
MKENLFEMGANFSDGWSSDNKEKPKKKITTEIKEPHQHKLHFSKEKRRGKTVSIVQPFWLEKKELQALLKTLKKKIGTGGTVKEDALEFQGEIEEPLITQLKHLGYGIK